MTGQAGTKTQWRPEDFGPPYESAKIIGWMWILYEEDLTAAGWCTGDLALKIAAKTGIAPTAANRAIRDLGKWWGSPPFEITGGVTQVTEVGIMICDTCQYICGGWNPHHPGHQGLILQAQRIARAFLRESWWTKSDTPTPYRGDAIPRMGDLQMLKAKLTPTSTQVLAGIYGMKFRQALERRIVAWELILGTRITEGKDGADVSPYGNAIRGIISEAAGKWRQLENTRRLMNERE